MSCLCDRICHWICRKLLGSGDACSYFTGSKYTVVMVADPGTFSGTPEAVHFEESLKNAVHLPSGSMLCPRIAVGELLGQPTIVATSGECLHGDLTYVRIIYVCLCKMHPKLRTINLHNVTHSLTSRNRRERIFVAQISILTIAFLSLVSRNLSLMQTT